MVFLKRSWNKRRLTPMSEINVTPMIDVMLVLLVIFMVTAPLLTVGVKVNLPTANAPNISGQETPIVVHVNGEGRIFLGEIEVDYRTLPAKLMAITKENMENAKIFVRGDRSLSYGKIMEVMGCISSSGFKKVVLVTELPKKQVQNASKRL
ncbi:MAG: protein TolR [Holosporaceae bacterium]|jgi:biopolymer transport protein TolR|nr:protein TolR [Holosporaceae bacterium]